MHRMATARFVGCMAVLAISCSSGKNDSKPAAACPAGMIRISGAKFAMGNPEGRGKPDEHPQHDVTVSDFCIDKTEVTVKDFGACVAAGGCAKAMTEIS